MSFRTELNVTRNSMVFCDDYQNIQDGFEYRSLENFRERIERRL